jgi:hypothetical protein
VEAATKDQQIITLLEGMTMLEVSGLVKKLEDHFGVTAAMPMMAAMPAWAVWRGGGRGEDRVRRRAHSRGRPSVIKVVREVRPAGKLRIVTAALGRRRRRFRRRSRRRRAKAGGERGLNPGSVVARRVPRPAARALAIVKGCERRESNRVATTQQDRALFRILIPHLRRAAGFVPRVFAGRTGSDEAHKKASGSIRERLSHQRSARILLA